MMDDIRVIMCRIGKYPYITYIKPEEIRKIIGGDFEAAWNGLETVVLHRRQQDDLPRNDCVMIDGLFGDCIIAGVDGDGYRGLTRKEAFYLAIDVRKRFEEHGKEGRSA